MTTQLDVLPGLAGEVSARIPEPEHVSRDPLVMAYRMIHGSPFSDVGSRGCVARAARALPLRPAHGAARVRRHAGSWRRRGPSRSAAPSLKRSEIASSRSWIRRERDSFAGLFDAHLDDDENWRFATCLTHGDLGPEHVLVSASGDLAGVIDWEETSVGDPAWDFAYLLHAMARRG